MTRDPVLGGIEPLKNGSYTVGHVAKMLRVSHRTVTKWADSGMIRSYRLPGTRPARRFLAVDVWEFAREHGLAELALLEARTLFSLWVDQSVSEPLASWAAVSGLAYRPFDCAIALGAAIATPPAVAVCVVLGHFGGRSAAEAIAAGLRAAGTPVVYLASDDDPLDMPHALTVRAIHPAAVAGAVHQAIYMEPQGI